MSNRKPRKLEAARLSKDGKITDRRLERLVSAIANGEDVHPDDVRAAMKRMYDSGSGIAGELMLDPFESAFLVLALARFLDGKLSLDQAFAGVRSRVGRPGVPIQEQLRVARAVWEQYLPGKDSLEAVATRVGDKFGKEKKRVLKYLLLKGDILWFCLLRTGAAIFSCP